MRQQTTGRSRHKPDIRLSDADRYFFAFFRILLLTGKCCNAIICGHQVDGGLAQLGERLPYKQRVGGSSPSASTIFLPT